MRRVTLGLLAGLFAMGAAHAQAPSGQDLLDQPKQKRDAPRNTRDFGVTDPRGGCDLLERILAGQYPATPEDQERARFKVNACWLPVDDLTPEIVARRLGDKSLTVDRDRDQLTIYARSSKSSVRICCSIQGHLTQIGKDDSDLYAMRMRLKDLDRGFLTLFVDSDGRINKDDVLYWRGPNAPPMPAGLATAGDLKGTHIQTEIASPNLGETRKVSVYLPPGWSKDRTWPALFMTDNAVPAYMGVIEAMIETGKIRPIVVVSAESRDNAAQRMQEYVRGGPYFDGHMAFFADELTKWASDTYNVTTRREDRAVAGFSNGGEFAFWAGLLRPDVFATSIVMSPSVASPKPEDVSAPVKAVRARFHISGGLYEPGFEQTARQLETILRSAGFQVTGRYPAAGHMQDQWSYILHQALPQVFPPSLR